MVPAFFATDFGTMTQSGPDIEQDAVQSDVTVWSVQSLNEEQVQYAQFSGIRLLSTPVNIVELMIVHESPGLLC